MDCTKRQNKSLMDKMLGGMDKKSVSKQLLLGLSSGWFAGFVTIRLNKVVGLAVGSGIILLEIANENGYVTVNWNKINKKIDKVTDKLEETVTGQGPSLMDKVERYVERKAAQAQENVKFGRARAKHWYSNIVGETGPKLVATQIFLVSFVAGVAVSIATLK